jgi:hypothetical protein
MDTASSSSDFHVVRPCRTELLFFIPRLAEYGMRVRVNEAGGENATTTVDAVGIGEATFERVLSVDMDDLVFIDDNRGTSPHVAATEFSASACPRRAGARYDLGRVGK